MMAAMQPSLTRQLAASARALAAVVLLLVNPAPRSAGQDKPVEEQPEQYPDGPHREDTFYFCTACHAFKIVAAQRMSRTRWNDTLNDMVTRHNMPEIQGDDRQKILDYLAGAFPERTQPGGWTNPFAPN